MKWKIELIVCLVKKQLRPQFEKKLKSRIINTDYLYKKSASFIMSGKKDMFISQTATPTCYTYLGDPKIHNVIFRLSDSITRRGSQAVTIQITWLNEGYLKPMPVEYFIIYI